MVAVNTLSATQSTALLTDVDSDGVASSGDTLQTHVTITNTSSPGATATGVSLSEDLVNQTLVGGSVTITPIAVDDTGPTLVGNTPITGSIASLLANDLDPDGLQSGLTASIVAGSGTHGTIVDNLDGTYTFTPATGFAGTATFQYRVTDSQGLLSNEAATVSLSVTDPTWYVDSSAAAGGDGSFGHAFQTVGGAVTAAANNTQDAANGEINDTIFVYNEGVIYSQAAGVALATGEQLLGDGSALTSVNGHAVGVSTSNASFTVTGNSINAVTLGSDNTVSGLNISETGTSGNGIVNSGTVGTLHLSNISVNTTGNGIALTGGGTVDATTVGSGVNTITSSGGTALNVSNTTIGASGLTFQSISDTGGPSGIILNTTGALGGLTVTGDGTNATQGGNGSGGTIQNTSGAGISLNSTMNASFNYVNITNPGTDGIVANNINGFTFNRSHISDSSGTASDQGIQIGDFSTGTTVNGTINITNSIIGAPTVGGQPGGTNSPHDNIAAGVGAGTSTWNVTGDDLSNSGNIGLNFEFRNAAIISNLTVSNDTFHANNTNTAEGVHIQAASGTTGSLTSTIQNNNFANNNIAIDVNDDGSAHATYSILNNTIVNDWRNDTATSATGQTASHAINVFMATTSTSSAVMNTRVDGNTIGSSAIAGSGSSIGDGIRANFNGNGTANLAIDNNTIREAPIGRGIEVIGRNGTGTLNATITGNNVDHTDLGFDPANASNTPLAAILVQVNQVGTAGYTVRANIHDNTVPTGSASDLAGTGFLQAVQTQQAGTTTFQLVDNPPASANAAAELASHNTGSVSTAGTITLIAGPITTPPLLAAAGGVEAAINSKLNPFGTGTGGNPTDPGSPPSDGSQPGGPTSTPAASGTISTALTQADLDPLVAQAIANWEATGLTPEQDAYLRSVSFSVSDLGGVTLGSAQSGHVTLDDNAAGRGWYVDSNPADASEFPNATAPTDRLTDPSLLPAGHIDLLTTIEHELGHELGLDDSYAPGDSASLMYGYIVDGERRAPAAGQAAGGTPGNIVGEDFLVAPITASSFTLPAARSVTVTYNTTVTSQTNQLITPATAQGTVTSSFSTVQTSPVTSTSIESLTLGNLIFNDVNLNGVFDAGDSGINGVTLTLFADNNNNGTFDSGTDTQVGTSTTTAGGGFYSFSGLAPGNYIVRVDSSNFTSPGALAGYLRTTTNAGDPDTAGMGNVDNDSNGGPITANGVFTGAITLDYNTETTADPAQGNQLDINNTLDVGLIQNTPPVVDLNGAGAGTSATLGYTENAGATAIAPAATVTDATSADFSGGSLIVAFTANGTTADQLSVVTDATVTVAGSTVSVGGLAVGTINATHHGANGDSLEIDFNTADATPANVQTLVEHIGYANSSEDPSTAARSLSFTVDDGDGGTSTGSASATVNVTAVNDPPTLSATTTTTTYTEDGAAVSLFSGANASTVESGQTITQFTITVSNVSDTNEILNIDGSDIALTNGNTLTTSGGHFLTASVATSGGTATVTLSNIAGVSSTVLDGIINGITYRDSSQNPVGGTRTITITSLMDNGGTSPGADTTSGLTIASTVNVVPVNDVPVVSPSGSTPTYTELGAATAVDSTIGVSDVDSANLTGATVAISNAVSGDELRIGGTTSGTINNGVNGQIIYSFSGSTLTLSGTDTVADYQSALRSVTFDSTSHDPTLGPNTSRTINWQVDDGGSPLHASAVANSSVTVAAVNDAPTASAPASYSGTPNVAVTINGLTFGDVDSEGASELVTFTVGGGHLDATTGGGVTIGGSGTSTLTATGTIANLNTRFGTGTNNLTFTGTVSEQLNIDINDQGHTGASALDGTTSAQITLDQAPVVDLNGATAGTGSTLSYTENGAATAIAPAGTATDTDSPDFNGGSLTVDFSANGAAEDQLSILTDGTVTVSSGTVSVGGLAIGTVSGGSNGTDLVVSFDTADATPSSVSTLIEHIGYANNSDNPSTAARSVLFTVNDGDGASGSDTATVNVTAVNDAPVVGGTTGVNTAYTEQASAVAVDSGVTVNDLDSANLIGATVSITGGLQAGDTLHFTNQNGISFVSYSGGVLTLSGSSSVANYQTALRSVTFDNTSNDDPTRTSTTRTISWQVNDGSGSNNLSNTPTSTITITPVNDAPVIDTLQASANYTEQAAPVFLSPPISPAPLIGVHITDPDPVPEDPSNSNNGLMLGATVTITNAVAGDRLLVRQNPLDPSDVPVTDGFIIGTNIAFSYDASTHVLTFTSLDPNNPGDTEVDYEVALSNVTFDSTSDDPTNGGANPTRTLNWQVQDGGGTANGGNDLSPIRTSTVNVTATDDAPANTVPGAQSVNEDTSLVFSNANSNAISTSDSDNATGTEQVTLSVSHGALTLSQTTGLAFTTGDGTSDATMTFTGTVANVNAALNGLTYLGNGNYNGADTLTIHTDDQGNTGSGGPLTDQDSVAITVNAVNDAPVLSGLGDNPAYVENGAPVVLDTNSNASVSDVELDVSASHYSGATLTLARNGGANPDDVFGSVGSLDLTDVAGNGENVSLDGGAHFIGTYTQPGDGSISFTFNANATAADVDSVMRQISYQNTSDNPPASALIDFRFDDGNGEIGGQAQGSGGAGITTASVTVAITQINDRPFLGNVSAGAAYSPGSAGVVLSPGLLVNDLDATPPSPNVGIQDAVVTIAGGYLPGDQLFVNLPTDGGGHFIVDDGSGPRSSNITVGSNSFGRLVLVGQDNTLDYQLVLDAVSYRSTAADPSDHGFSSSRTISWQVNDGAPATPLLTLTAPTTPGGLSPEGVATADLNGDGALDLVTANSTSGNVTILLGSTATPGTFGPPNNIAAGAGAFDVAIADLSGDGNLDLAVADQSGGVSVLLGNGAGGFGAASNFAAGTSPVALDVADFNNDGTADLVVANNGSGNVSVLLGTGGGNFAAPVNFTTGSTPTGVAIGDFNNDGNLDLAVSDQGANSVAILLGNGAGGFGAATTFLTGALTSPQSVETADLNGDGNLDLVTGNLGTNDISVLLGNGSGGFSAPTTFAAGVQPFRLAIGDVNGDGRLDVSVANRNGGDVSVLLGNGDGTFAAATHFSLGAANPIAIALGDYNRDGDLDLAVTNSLASNVSVLLNNGTNNNAPVSTRLNFDVAPAVDLDGTSPGTGYATSYTTGTPAIAIVNNDSVTDPDTANADSMTIVLTNAMAGDALSVAGSLPGGIDSSIDTSVAGQITLRLTNSASMADYQTALSQVRFANSSVSPNTTDRDIAVVLAEGGITSNTAHATVHVIDATPPAKPPAPDLTDASDSGVSHTDNITNVAASTFSGTVEPGTTVRLYDSDGSTVIGTGAADAQTGAYTITSSALSQGTHHVTVTATDASNNTSVHSDALDVTIDTTAPAPMLTAADATTTFRNSTVHYRLSYPETTFGVDASDFTLTTTGAVAGAAITGVTEPGGVGTPYVISVSTGTGLGTLEVDLRSSGTGISDTAGNLSGGATGPVYTVADRAPVAHNDVVTLSAAQATLTGNVLANDTDADGDTLRVTSVYDYLNGVQQQVAVPASGSVQLQSNHGVFTISADGSYSFTANDARPAQGHYAEDPLVYTTSDGFGGTASAQLDVNLAAQPRPSTETFNFNFVNATVSYGSDGQSYLTGPDGVTHNVTGVNLLVFNDGRINEGDYNQSFGNGGSPPGRPGSALVDDLYYDSQYHDVYLAGIDPEQHYAQYGWHEGRNPDPYFNTNYYLSQNPDVAAAGINPLNHYDQYGWREGRNTSPNFDTRDYELAYLDVAAAGIDPLGHYLQYGELENRLTFPVNAGTAGPIDGFDPNYYLTNNPDVAAAGINPFQHYLQYGWHEGRNPSADFNTNFYESHNPDVAAAGIDPLIHYDQYGWHEGRDPSAVFSTTGYLTTYVDVAAANINPLQHYLQVGMAEGRSPTG
jgi:hypothetical protein